MVQDWRQAAPWASGLCGLEAGERLAVRAFRHWVLGLRGGAGAHWSAAWNELALALGPREAKAAVSGLAGLVRELAQHARRPIRHHHPCCGRLSGDEVALVQFLGACQRAEWVRARAAAQWLVHDEAVGGLIEAGARLAGALGRASLQVPDRLVPGPDRPAAPSDIESEAAP